MGSILMLGIKSIGNLIKLIWSEITDIFCIKGLVLIVGHQSLGLVADSAHQVFGRVKSGKLLIGAHWTHTVYVFLYLVQIHTLVSTIVLSATRR
jgi:hypothetical protein